MSKKIEKKLKLIKALRNIVQLMLFIIPIVISLFCVDYYISWDQHYVENVNERVLNNHYGDNSITDFSDSVIAKYDSEGKYEKKVWKLQNKELYYYENFLMGVVLGAFFQIFIFFWNVYIDEIEYWDN